MPTSHPALTPYGAHQTKDGLVIFGIQNEREWVTFCAKVMDRPELATDPRFRDNNARRERRVELTALIEDYFADMTSIEVVQKLDAAGIANGRLNEPARCLGPRPVQRARPLARDRHAGRAGSCAAAAVHLH